MHAALLFGFLHIAASPASEHQHALTALNRLAFGMEPNSITAVLAMGVDAYIEAQLHPENSPDTVPASLHDTELERMDAKTLWETFDRKSDDPNRASKKDFYQAITRLRIGRARYAQAQLNEVMVDFWFNHFNVAVEQVHTAVLPFERDVIRAHMWGNFADLLVATTKSAAMMKYLNNATSVAPVSHRPPHHIDPAKTADLRGLNENYARELMELHTLGVDGGYTQADVTEAARVLTGWSVTKPEEGATFVFRQKLHDVDAKHVMGINFAAGGGQDEGEILLRTLGHSPITAHHLARKLCERFVSDTPSATLVDQVAQRFLATDGNLRETLRAVITSQAFFDPVNAHAKIKTPFEYTVSALRALDANVTDTKALLPRLGEMGEPLYKCQPPTGYADRAEAWLSSGGVLSRLNFALSLAENKFPGIEVNFEKLLTPAQMASTAQAVPALSTLLVGGELSASTRATMATYLGATDAPHADPSANTQLPLAAALILGSPDFQRQ